MNTSLSVQQNQVIKRCIPEVTAAKARMFDMCTIAYWEILALKVGYEEKEEIVSGFPDVSGYDSSQPLSVC